MSRLVNSFTYDSHQPASRPDDELDNIMLRSSPIFDRDGRAAYNMSRGGFAEKLTGAVLNAYADRLMRSCLEVMRADRTQSRRLEPAIVARAQAS